MKELDILVGRTFPASDYLEITQDMVNQFADATGDHQWIHVDAERAQAIGGTIVHGFYTLSLMSAAMADCVKLPIMNRVKSTINYGLNKVRFTGTVPVGSKLRAKVTLDSYKETPAGVQVTFKVEAEIEGREKPVMVSEHIAYYLF